MEESWYLTPPPCFVSGPYDTKPSSLENLLIEQPGVHFINKRQQQRNDEKRRLTKGEQALQKLKTPKETTTKVTDACKTVSMTPSAIACVIQEENKRRQHLLEIHEQKKFINSCQSQISAAQKVRSSRNCSGLIPFILYVDLRRKKKNSNFSQTYVQSK